MPLKKQVFRFKILQFKVDLMRVEGGYWQMIKRFYMFFIVLLVVGGIGFLFYLSQQSQKVQRLPWTNLNSVPGIASKIFEIVSEKLKTEKILFLGVDPGQELHFKIWSQFLAEISNSGMEIEAVLIEPELPLRDEYWPTAKPFDIRKDEKLLVELLLKKINTNGKMVFILPHVYAVQIFKDNPAKRVINALKQKIFSLSLLDINTEGLPCVSDDMDYTGQSTLGCAVREKLLQSKLSKNTKSSLYSLTIDEYSPEDLFIFVR